MSDKDDKQKLFSTEVKRRVKAEPFVDLTDRPFAYIEGMTPEEFEAALIEDKKRQDKESSEA